MLSIAFWHLQRLPVIPKNINPEKLPPWRLSTPAKTHTHQSHNSSIEHIQKIIPLRTITGPDKTLSLFIEIEEGPTLYHDPEHDHNLEINCNFYYKKWSIILPPASSQGIAYVT